MDKEDTIWIWDMYGAGEPEIGVTDESYFLIPNSMRLTTAIMKSVNLEMTGTHLVLLFPSH